MSQGPYDPIEHAASSLEAIASALGEGTRPDADGPATVHEHLRRIADALEDLLPIAERIAAAMERYTR